MQVSSTALVPVPPGTPARSDYREGGQRPARARLMSAAPPPPASLRPISSPYLRGPERALGFFVDSYA